MKGSKTMKQLFDKPQLKKGTYRAFIWEPSSVMIIVLTDDRESIYIESAESFAIKAYNELFDYNLSFDTQGGISSVNRMIADGCEEVIV